MAIKDGRILLDDADTLTNWGSSGGGGGFGIVLDPQTVYQGTNSIAAPISTTEAFVYYNAGSAQNWSNNEFYFLMQVGVIGDLAVDALSFRFAGSTIGNYFQFKVASPTTWPATSVGDGWYQFVVDIERTPDVVNSPPATSAIQYVGYIMEIGNMGKQDNTWIDAIYRRPYTSPGIIIEGTNGGSPYTWQDVLDYTSTNDIATCIPGPGGSIVLSTPVQFGNNTTSSTHEFSDTNKLILWDDQPFANVNSYKIEVVNTSGSTLNLTAGVKSGSGVDATGTQGWSIQAADAGNRWSLIANNATANVNLFGCSFSHSDIIRTESSNTEVISTFLIDGNEYVQSTSAGSSIYLRNTVINANTADGEAYLKTVDIDNIDYSTFEFSDGHALEISSTSAASSNTFTSLENIFTGYTNLAGGASTDAAIYNNSGQEITIQQSGGSLGLDSYRNGVSSTTIIENKVNVKIENVIEGSEVRMWNYSGGPNGGPANTEVEISGGVESIANTDTLTTGSVTFNVDANLDVLVKVFKTDFNIERFVLNSGDGTTRRVDQSRDRVFSNP